MQINLPDYLIHEGKLWKEISWDELLEAVKVQLGLKSKISQWQATSSDTFNPIKTDDGIIVGNKKYSLLSAPHDPKNGIYSWDHKDKNEQKGISGLTYMTGKAGMEQAKKQKKKLFKTGEEADAFINQFPWESIKDKIFAFVNLFGLQKSGFWDPNHKKWLNVGSVGYATLSEVYDYDNVREVRWEGDEANITWDHQTYPQPVVAFEDCI